MADGSIVIDVIDNGGQWTHREWRMLRYLGVETQILPNSTPLDNLRDLDGLVLSGGAARVGLTGELGNCGEYLALKVPILGICAGHQFMARFYGGDAGEAPRPEFGAASISLVDGGGLLFEGTPSEQIVWESHNDEVTEIPPRFKVVAYSDSCGVQGMENEELDRFGLQFHPEVNDTEYGARIFENFVEICKRARKTA
ncbi:MAG: GMP synthase subunit A [Candidatus Thalassarchaeaceae archaeon]|jgi:GMP synthase (glutamine-hydrolysing)|nr:GMP synthase subunit A [Candidatus Thalassarchaeaceae archaeon]MDP6703227.1 GMP synthase subunit A [Candidatus Thalassarchaeaceae archaeon]MDP7003998.1 GMP synthase subunit A [Candidatus Thalassarchaeaceae archaeon]